MTFLIAAAGTGGHVFPGLSVGEALVDRGIERSRVHFVGGDRLEATVYPEAGFPFHQVKIAGLQRSMSPENLRLPMVVRSARNRIGEVIIGEGIEVVLGLGGYVTIPTGLAARRLRVPFFNSEQNAKAGLANRVSARWARRSFGSFPETEGLPHAEWVGNPVRPDFWRFDRIARRKTALRSYRLRSDQPVLGVFGGSLGSGVINQAVSDMVTRWDGPPVQVVHLTGERFFESLADRAPALGITWLRLGFETQMADFYAVSDLVLARGGGAVAELTATATPSILVPGAFGSGGHQEGNASFLAGSGAADLLLEEELGTLASRVRTIMSDEKALDRMRVAASEVAKPDAAHTIADAMIEVVG